MVFNNADPKHARINPLRARKDKPHIWFEDGYWRVCPQPIKRRQRPDHNKAQWAKAHVEVAKQNTRLQWDRAHHAEYVRWEVQ